MICKKCKRNLPEEEFSEDTDSKRGKQFYCKECYRKICYGFYKKLKRDLVRFMGGKCAKCGITLGDANNCFSVFVVDEVKPPPKEGEKRIHGASKANMGRITKKRVKEIKQEFLEGKSQLLCQNCSAIKSSEQKDYTNRFAGAFFNHMMTSGTGHDLESISPRFRFFEKATYRNRN